MMRWSAVAACSTFGVLIALTPQQASAKCMVHQVAGPDGTPRSVMAVAPDTGSADLSGAGFTDTGCGQLDHTAYRSRVCHPETIGNHGVQHQLEAQFGVTFAQLCQAAEAAAGLPQVLPGTNAAGALVSSNRPPASSPRGPSLLGRAGNPGGASSVSGGN